MAGLTERSQVGKREDFADLIAIADVKNTPFISQANKGREPVNTLFDWQVDAYEPPKRSGTVDGEDVVDYENAAQNRAKLRNHVQVFRRTAKVSRLAENVSNVAGLGRKKELANSIRKKLVEIKRDMECGFLSDNDAQQDDGANAYLSRAMGTWITGTAHSYLDFPARYKPSGSQLNTTAVASLTEEGDVQEMLQAIFDATGFSGSYVLFAGSELRRAFTTMTRWSKNGPAGADTDTFYTVRQFSFSGTDQKIVNTTSVYEGDYGIIRVVSDNFIGCDAAGAPDTDRGYLVDMGKVHVRYNSMPSVERLPDLGGGPRALVESVAGLQFDNTLCAGKFLPA